MSSIHMGAGVARIIEPALERRMISGNIRSNRAFDHPAWKTRAPRRAELSAEAAKQWLARKRSPCFSSSENDTVHRPRQIVSAPQTSST